MRFLIDENLSPRLVVAVGDLFPGSVHVETLGMRGGTDAAVWTVARDRGFAILTKDEDFSGMSVLYGAPPKVIHLRMGNVGTQAVADLLTEHHARIVAFGDDQATSLFVLP